MTCTGIHPVFDDLFARVLNSGIPGIMNLVDATYSKFQNFSCFRQIQSMKADSSEIFTENCPSPCSVYST